MKITEFKPDIESIKKKKKKKETISTNFRLLKSTIEHLHILSEVNNVSRRFIVEHLINAAYDSLKSKTIKNTKNDTQDKVS